MPVFERVVIGLAVPEDPDSDVPAYKPLRHLGFRGPLRQSVLAEELGTGRSNASKMLNRLEKAGLVCRRDDRDDARGAAVALTPAGRRAARRLFDIGDAMVQEPPAGWSADRIATFCRDPTELAAHMREFATRLTRPTSSADRRD